MSWNGYKNKDKKKEFSEGSDKEFLKKMKDEKDEDRGSLDFYNDNFESEEDYE